MKSIINKLKSFFTDRPKTKRLLLIFISLFVVLIIARVALTPSLIHLTNSWLAKQDIEASIEDIDLNIINGTVTLTNAKGIREGKTLYEVGQITIFWSWSPLSDKTIEVTAFNIHHLDVHIKNYSDEIIIGGVQIPLTANADSPPIIDEERDVKPWAASLGKVTFTELDVCYEQHASTFSEADEANLVMDYCVNFDEMQWAGTIGYATDKSLLETTNIPILTSGDFSLNGLTITDNKLNKILLHTELSALKSVTTHGLKDIRLDTVSMHNTSIMQRDDDKHKDSIRFTTLAFNNITFKNLDVMSIDTFELLSPGVYLVKDKNNIWEYQQWIPGAQSTKPAAITNKPNKSTQPVSASTFKFNINQINIDDADFCHLDKSVNLYYCYTHENLRWTGTISYDEALKVQPPISIAGDLKLNLATIKNLTINRELAHLGTLSINKLGVNGQNASIKSFEIKNLSALQRSKNKNDDTIAFDSLKIDSISYKPQSLRIKTISLDSLKQTLSKNKDGSWEHDKWLVQSKPAEKSSTKKTQKPSASKKMTAKKSKSAFDFALGKITIETKQPISYTDNSTSPPLKTAFTEFFFKLSDLDSKKPENDSEVILKSKSSRYATIDIKGTVRPLAKEISFNADGKLRGMDLRTISPVTRKSIGHIIRNGQLDADLTLLATHGKLDSNVALTLYKFDIESVSKEDAKELDAELGLPLNQTLTLLRDKKDNIYLNIPITGDLDNPDFDPMDAIVSATSKAATGTLITYFTPYGLIYAGGNFAFDLATALNFDPIIFNKGSSELLTNNKKQLDELSILLTEKPQIHLKLCGMTNNHDAFTLFPELEEEYKNKNEEKKSPEVVLSKEQKSALETLARQRQVNSKDYLVEHHNLEHDRLILCVPKHHPNLDDISGVDVNI